MKRMWELKKVFSMFVFLALTVSVLLTACGGGGGGGSDGGGGSGGDSSISYTGSTSQATVNSTNAEQIATSGYQGGSSGALFGVVQSGMGGSIEQSRLLMVAQALETAIREVNISEGIVAGAIQTGSRTVNGNCGGSYSYTISYDDVTGAFNGTFNFSSYCNDGSTISGSVSASGQINLNTRVIMQFNMSTTSLIFTSGNDSFTISGSFNIIINGSTTTATMNILLKDNATGKIYWLQNHTLTITRAATYVDGQISGRYYHPDYGYITISTTTPFRINNGSKWPFQGVLIVEGMAGSASGNTSARLTVLSATQYQVVADTDGDGAFDDYDSGPKNWSSL